MSRLPRLARSVRTGHRITVTVHQITRFDRLSDGHALRSSEYGSIGHRGRTL